ncbi:glutathione S-transferase 1-1-like [Chelonus insularis]|uniref:glutathione S-transferase 1-1-like n=1 Tax=Chelonus insularis TaxID=460826 RepID=UPI00158B1270|nr:glutathione S-transferase 1-1-like [Chelonus insularis]
MPIDLYHTPGSSPSRAVRLVAAALGVNLNLKLLNLAGGEHLKPEFIKINPQHCVPTLVDGDLTLWESRAISCYLANQYGKNDSLYPKDPKARALVDQRLYFDMGTVYQSFGDYYYPMLFAGAPHDPTKYEKIGNCLDLLNKFLEGQNYVAGNNMTIADLSLVTSVTNIQLIKFDISKYANVTKWLERIKSEAPKYEEINGEGLKAFQGLIDVLTKK